MAADDAHWMRRALALAERGRGSVSPNPMVGCVLVRDGAVVGEAWHAVAGGPHAEVSALEAAGDRARGATCYVTLEPCTHHGRTGPCAQALAAAGVGRVVVATADPNPVAAGGAEVLRRAGVAVEVGLFGGEARRQNEVFFHGVACARPFVIAKAATSLDGRIAAADGSARWLTGPAARARVHALRSEVDAVLVGSGTVLADDPQLTCRLEGYDGRQPLRGVLDRRGRLRADHRVVDEAAPSVVFVGEAADGVAARLAGPTTEVVPIPGSGPGVDPAAVLACLFEREVRSVLVEGGASVLASFLRAGLVDRFELHQAPVLLGPRGRPVLDGDWPNSLAAAPRWRREHVETVGGDLVASFRPAAADGGTEDAGQQRAARSEEALAQRPEPTGGRR